MSASPQDFADHEQEAYEALMRDVERKVEARREATRMSDVVNHPKHYAGNGIEVIDVIEAFDLGFHEGNVLKYVLRWRQKGGVEDLQKARWYLDRFIQQQLKQKI